MGRNHNKNRPRNHNKNRPRKRDYDPVEDKYGLTARELANLERGAAANAAIGAANASRVYELLAAGRCVTDIVILTGLSRSTVYRALRRMAEVDPVYSRSHGKRIDPLLF